MYSRNLFHMDFRDRFLVNNDIFAVRTRCVRRENRSSSIKNSLKDIWLTDSESTFNNKGE